MPALTTPQFPSPTSGPSGGSSKVPVYIALAVGAVALAICILLAKETKKMKKDLSSTKRDVQSLQTAKPPQVEEDPKLDALDKKVQGTMQAMQRMQMGFQAMGQKVTELDQAEQQRRQPPSPPQPEPPVEQQEEVNNEEVDEYEEVEELEEVVDDDPEGSEGSGEIQIEEEKPKKRGKKKNIQL